MDERLTHHQEIVSPFEDWSSFRKSEKSGTHRKVKAGGGGSGEEGREPIKHVQTDANL